MLSCCSFTFRAAESFFKRSVEMREHVLGPDHPDLAQSLNNMAALYNDRKLYSKAEPLYERALKIRLKVRKLTYSTFEGFLKRSVEMREHVLGPDHPDLAQSLNNMAALYNDRKLYSKAEPLFERALKIRLKVSTLNLL